MMGPSININEIVMSYEVWEDNLKHKTVLSHRCTRLYKK